MRIGCFTVPDPWFRSPFFDLLYLSGTRYSNYGYSETGSEFQISITGTLFPGVSAVRLSWWREGEEGDEGSVPHVPSPSLSPSYSSHPLLSHYYPLALPAS